MAAHYVRTIEPGKSVRIRIKLDNRDKCSDTIRDIFTKENFDDIVLKRKVECNEFYSKVISGITLIFLYD